MLNHVFRLWSQLTLACHQNDTSPLPTPHKGSIQHKDGPTSMIGYGMEPVMSIDAPDIALEADANATILLGLLCEKFCKRIF